MTVAEITALRTAFGELMGAERRLRARDPRHAKICALVKIAKDEELTAGELAKRAMWEQVWEDGLAAHSEEELLAAAAVMRTIAAVLEQVGIPRT
jgi:hypothetical protein